LLMDRYGLVAWDIPEGQLCPPVANRANYIHWLEDLLRLSRPRGMAETGADVRGLDIGVGANCVYPLLGAAINGWSFVVGLLQVKSS
jgi:23S rRNA (adenine1618-N6)-methyltransferase